MDTLNRSHLQSLVAEQPRLCVSIYTETRRGGRERDFVQFRDQIYELQHRLKDHRLSDADIQRILKPAHALVENAEFWKNTSDGLATFLQDGAIQTFRLPLRFRNQAFIGNHYHVKPLIPWFMGDGHFYILAISQNHVRLLEATTHEVRRKAMPEAPASKAEALRTHDRDEMLNVHSHTGPVGTAMQAIFHGHGVGIDDYKDEITKYLQTVDKAVCSALNNGQTPLLIATVEFLAGIYRKVTKYAHILDAIIPGNPDRVSDEELHAKANPLLAPVLRQRETRILGQFQRFSGTGRTTHTLSEVLPAAYRGEFQTLLLVDGAEAWGKFEPAANFVEEHAEPEPGDEELTNLAASYTLQHNHNVVIVGQDAAFDGAPMAGIYHLPMAHHGKSRR